MFLFEASIPQLLEKLEKVMNGSAGRTGSEVTKGSVDDSGELAAADMNMNRRGSVTFNTTVHPPLDILNGTLASDGLGDNESARGCKYCLSRCRLACAPCNAKLHKPHPKRATKLERFKYVFMCPPHGFVAKWVTLGTIAVLIWAVLWSVLGDDVMPGGNIFGIVILFIASTIGGYLAGVIKLPPLLGKSSMY